MALTWEEKLARLDSVVERTERGLRRLSMEYRTEQIDLGAWRRGVERQLELSYQAAARLGYGALDLPQAILDIIRRVLEKQRAFLEGFVHDIQRALARNRGDFVSSTAMDTRVGLYANSARDVFYEAARVAGGMQGRRLGWFRTAKESCGDCIALSEEAPKPLEAWRTVPGRGETECDGNCKCYLAPVRN